MTLGFALTPENPWSLLRQYFPSKAGGTPHGWILYICLLENGNLCDFCGKPLQFLLQVYAPLPEESTFHRTLFVFMCPSMTCLLRDQHGQWKRHPEAQSRSVKVFRCQLPKVNSFYSSDAPTVDSTEQPLTSGAQCSATGVVHGRETKFVVAVERFLIDGPLTRAIESYVDSWGHLTTNPFQLLLVALFGQNTKSQMRMSVISKMTCLMIMNPTMRWFQKVGLMDLLAIGNVFKGAR
ncbi:hypothetical protein CASFOL_008928 [Castilleja foliolosa]|uniref:Programmed cell death protein 2 C-terminal domain-containing protein n=1 Tax=Castilleja foliolosa TaxID=1961234 RepID=A0ABD3E0D4_9LAMI